MFSRRRVAALVLTALAAVTVGYRLDGAQAATPQPQGPRAAAQSAATKTVGGYWMLGADGLRVRLIAPGWERGVRRLDEAFGVLEGFPVQREPGFDERRVGRDACAVVANEGHQRAVGGQRLAGR